MTLTTISPGVDTGFSTKLNDNFEYCSNEVYTRDLTTSDKSVTITANTFTRYFKITFGYTLRGSCGSANGSEGVIVLSVGGSGILTRSTQAGTSNPSSDSCTGCDSIIFRAADIDLTSSIAVTVVTSSSTTKGVGGTSSQACNYLIIEGV